MAVQVQEGRVSGRIAAYNEANSDNPIIISGEQAAPVGMYGYYIRNGDLLKFSGFGSRDKDLKAINGQIGEGQKTLEYGVDAARGSCMNFLNNITIALDGNLDGVKGIDITVFINAESKFTSHPKIADGASKLLEQVFGRSIGNPVRAAIGASNLPNEMTVEIKGDVLITKELASQLDLRDSKKLGNFLSATHEIAGISHEHINKDNFKDDLHYLAIDDQMRDKHSASLEKYTNYILEGLNKISEQEFSQKLEGFSGKDAFIKEMSLTGPEQKSNYQITKQDVIDKICYDAQNLNLKVNPTAGKAVSVNNVGKIGQVNIKEQHHEK